MESSDLFVVLAAGGILCMFGMQAFIHMGSSLHLLPTKGNDLTLYQLWRIIHYGDGVLELYWA